MFYIIKNDNAGTKRSKKYLVCNFLRMSRIYINRRLQRKVYGFHLGSLYKYALKYMKIHNPLQNRTYPKYWKRYFYMQNLQFQLSNNPAESRHSSARGNKSLSLKIIA